MVCHATQHNSIEPAGGNSGLRPYCMATPAVLLIGDSVMKRIPLTQGKFTLVDDEDYNELSKHKWHLKRNKNTLYAVRDQYVKGDRGHPIRLRMHRLIMNAPKGMDVDHRDGNGLDNRRFNLRLCTNKQNSMNRGPNKNNTSGYKGVFWCNQKKKWKAMICIEGKSIHLGFFFCIIKAAKAYNNYIMDNFNEFGYFNKIQGRQVKQVEVVK